jgi:hypothetical protein
MDIPRCVRSWAVLLVVAWAVVSGSAIQAEEWEWTVVPYLWAAGAGLDVEVHDEVVLGGDIAFSDLVDKLEIGAMVHVEGRAGKAGFFWDGVYVSLRSCPAAPRSTRS